ncbi:hypothetical protein DN069_34320 [Streptacidiphilus pinicola]|uniref:Uncharacterized protein n=1 Tax=Streptacidiphilus pinicola TaxID=2219663 RepID=A0A2X0JW67_9ACTN|nr:hypothetical protein [Streptacidiphilus pinicola]RAG81175.1 hypothetical protein DN069_34320 [Streptacidiphilus pinicola]
MSDATPEPGRRKGATIAVGAAVWLAIAGGSAAIAANMGGAGVAVAAAVPSASASASTSASATAAPSLPAETPTPTPSPSSTVKGYVNGSTHSGDLRFFLLPVPDDALAYGDTDGTAESLSDIAKQMDNSSTSKSILQQYGCSGGAYRIYRTNDGQYTVTARLIHFDGSGHAADWVSGLTFGHGNSFDVSGISDAKGLAINPTDSNGVGTLMGLSHVGDVEYEIDVEGTGSLDHSLLTPLMQREEKLLETGR